MTFNLLSRYRRWRGRRWSALFVEAAGLLDEHELHYACVALYRAVRNTHCLGFVTHAKMLCLLRHCKPDGLTDGDPWWNGEEDREARILALLFCAAMAESGET